MSETIEKKSTTELKKKEESINKIRIFPQICAVTNDEGTGYDIDIYLPGVEKESIKLKMAKDLITVNGESETSKFDGSYQLYCPVDVSKAKSTYKEGLLKIHVPFKEIELNTIDVKVE
ncbi:MAG: Hsp20/alpha crystallin family protein [Candidatus Lokiarchaeota archaeon]